MRKWLILLSLFSLTSANAAPAWTWVDSNGQIHYSDRPVPGARQIDLPGSQAGVQSLPAPQRPAQRSNQAARRAPEQQAAATDYQALNIVSPAAQETLWNIGGTLTVQVAVAPALQAGHRLDVLLDGQRANLNVASFELSVPNVFRGMHTLEAVIVDATGREVLRSPPVPIIVQQTSVQNPNSPQAGPAGRSGN